MKITVLVAEDQPLMRAGIVMLLRAESDIEVVGEASDGAEAVAMARDLRPDIVLMDLRMPGTDGIAATRDLVAVEPSGPDHLTRVLILTMFNENEPLYGAIRAGASGYLLKHAAPQDLVFAVRKVAGGDFYLDPAVAGRVVAAIADTTPMRRDLPELVATLTAREREVLDLIADGLSNADIQNRLHLSEATVKTHVSRILMKTGCGNRTNAVVLAYQSGFKHPPARS